MNRRIVKRTVIIDATTTHSTIKRSPICNVLPGCCPVDIVDARTGRGYVYGVGDFNPQRIYRNSYGQMVLSGEFVSGCNEELPISGRIAYLR